MTRRSKINPAWADQVTQKFCDQISAAAKRYRLPRPQLDEKCVIPDAALLGEGAYGAVYDTDEPDCVFKITSDATEAHFVATALALRRDKGVDPPGMIDFRAVYALPHKSRGDDIFLIWREKAVTTGLPENAKSCAMSAFIDLLENFYESGEYVNEYLYDKIFQEQLISKKDEYWKWIDQQVSDANDILNGKLKSPVRHRTDIASAIADCYKISDEMMHIGQDAYYVADAIRTYLKSGILICDIHSENVGIVNRGRCNSKQWVITDPGHVLILKRNLSDVPIPVLA